MTRNFTTASDDDARALDKLAAELRGNKRARRIADGLPISEAIDLFFAEQAGRCGIR